MSARACVCVCVCVCYMFSLLHNKTRFSVNKTHILSIGPDRVGAISVDASEQAGWNILAVREDAPVIII